MNVLWDVCGVTYYLTVYRWHWNPFIDLGKDLNGSNERRYQREGIFG